jgi:hypothetical protein
VLQAGGQVLENARLVDVKCGMGIRWKLWGTKYVAIVRQGRLYSRQPTLKPFRTIFTKYHTHFVPPSWQMRLALLAWSMLKRLAR